MCSSINIIPDCKSVENKEPEKKFANKITRSEKFMAGCKALGGQSAAEIASELDISRQYVYTQKKEVANYADSLDASLPEVQTLRLDKIIIEMIVLVLTLACQAPAKGIEIFFEMICNMSISEGRIRSILYEASKRAQAFDDQVEISGIKQIAIDEIFQNGKPILTGIDLISTYTFLFAEEKNRTGETWSIYLDDLKEHGLEPENCISDEATGLKAGLQEVYPEANHNPDVFHGLNGVGKEIGKLERKTNSLLQNEYDLEEKIGGKRPRAKTFEALEVIKPKVQEAIRIYDQACILFCWLKTLLGFSGYCFEDALNLCYWVLDELEVVAANIPLLLKEIVKVRKLLPRLLSFIKRLEQGMKEISIRTGIPVEAFILMYQHLSVNTGSLLSNEIQCKLVSLLGARFCEAQEEFQRLLKNTKKASSMVENLNGRIRVFIEVKRVIPPSFFILLKVYFNTQRYKRSRCVERVGKSPLELLTGQPQPNFLEALGYR